MKIIKRTSSLTEGNGDIELASIQATNFLGYNPAFTPKVMKSKSQNFATNAVKGLVEN